MLRPGKGHRSRNVDPIAVGRERGAKHLAACGKVAERLSLVHRPAEYRFIAGVMTHKAKVVGPAFAVLERHLGDHADPVGVLASTMAGLEAEIAEAVVDRP